MKRSFNFAIGNRFTDGLIIIISVVLLVVFLREPKPPKISIHQAAKDGNIEAVKQHLASGVNVNAKIKYGSTPLHWAASKVHNKTAKLLIKEGADVNAVNKDGLSPLDYAENETFGFLIDHGAKSGAELKAEGK